MRQSGCVSYTSTSNELVTFGKYELTTNRGAEVSSLERNALVNFKGNNKGMNSLYVFMLRSVGSVPQRGYYTNSASLKTVSVTFTRGFPIIWSELRYFPTGCRTRSKL